jgi:hypothetical protein
MRRSKESWPPRKKEIKEVTPAAENRQQTFPPAHRENLSAAEIETDPFLGGGDAEKGRGRTAEKLRTEAR